MAVKSSPPAIAFAKALRSLETGGLTYSDVLAEIKDLLAAGASPTELREILLGRDLIEPLSVQARVEMLALLNSAMLRERKRAAAEAQNAKLEGQTSAGGVVTTPPPISVAKGDSLGPQEKAAAAHSAESAQPSAAESAAIAKAAELEASLAAARAALETERNKARDAARAATAAAADSLASLEAARLRIDEAAEDADRFRAESASLRKDLSERETIVSQLRQTLVKRDAQLAAITQEHAEMSSALQTRVKRDAQWEAESQSARARESTLAADLAKARAALDAEQSRAQGNSKSLVDKLVATEAALARAEESLRKSTRDDGETRTLRESLAARDAELATLKREHGSQVSALEIAKKGRGQLEADFQAAQTRADALAADLRASQETLQAMTQRLERSESLLAAVRTELEDVKSEHAAQTPLPQNPQVLKFPQTLPLPQAPAAAKEDPVPTVRIAVTPKPTSPAAKPAQYKSARPRALIAAALLVIAVAAVWLLNRHSAAPDQPPTAPVAAIPQPGKTIRDCPSCPAMTVLPTGRFKQGTPGGDGEAPTFERPLHWVSIGRPIAMSTSPVTVDEYAKFIAATNRDMQGCDTYDGAWKHRADKNWQDPGFVQTGEHPVTCVSSNDAAAYAAWLSTQTGHKYRLPSASEWEYAARAGAEAVQPWGPVAADACRFANVADQSAADQYPGWRIFDCDDAYANTSPVGSFEANAFGLKDMLGNVFQWTEDCWNADYTGAPVDGSARADGDCTQRELRGGSWFSSPEYVRANYRNRFAADYRTSSVGIRVVRELGT